MALVIKFLKQTHGLLGKFRARPGFSPPAHQVKDFRQRQGISPIQERIGSKIVGAHGTHHPAAQTFLEAEDPHIESFSLNSSGAPHKS